MEHIDITMLLTTIGVITAITNIVVQVLKKITWDKLPTNLVAMLVAVALTLAAGAAYAQVNGITITWYMVVAAVVVGLMAAYAAMFGFDKLRETLEGGKSNESHPEV